MLKAAKYSMKTPFLSGSTNQIIFYSIRSEYEHPLVVGNVRMKAHTMGIEIKTANDWEQFVEDKEVQGVLFSPDHKKNKISGFRQMSEELKEEDSIKNKN